MTSNSFKTDSVLQALPMSRTHNDLRQTSAMATWNVSLFAYLRERHGDLVTVESESNSAAIMSALARQGVNVTSCRLAAGNEFVTENEVIAEGTDIALIPPVSGG
jgi:molybdopterin converting factor small subunit